MTKIFLQEISWSFFMPVLEGENMKIEIGNTRAPPCFVKSHLLKSTDLTEEMNMESKSNHTTNTIGQKRIYVDTNESILEITLKKIARDNLSFTNEDINKLKYFLNNLYHEEEHLETHKSSDGFVPFLKTNTEILDDTGLKMIDITYYGEKLIYKDDVEYGKGKLKKGSEKKTLTNNNPIEKFKKNHWLLCFILTALFSLPQCSQTVDFYKKSQIIIDQFIKINILKEGVYMNVIKDSEYIRDEANSNSPTIITVAYAEQLLVIGKVHFWYKVKYVTEGKEYIGWIPNVSVGIEDSINDL